MQLDVKAVNNVLEALYVLALQNTLLRSMQKYTEDSEWTNLPEEKAVEWITAILAGEQKMSVRYMDATERYVPGLTKVW